MLNEEEILILNNKGKDITSKVILISNLKVDVKYSNNKIYSYNKSNLLIIKNLTALDDCVIKTFSKTLSSITKVGL